MTAPSLGKSGGRALPLDLDRLVSTRMLLTANSGAGKSWALRRLLEQTQGRIQQLVLDPEGEFYTLRERFDYVLAGRGGDCPAEPRSAGLLARRLLELGASAILDLYELAPRDRVRFVRLFLEGLIDAPRTLWHPVLVVLDEAHAFAPENGHGEAESAEAVARLMAQGRKRGFAGILATQRLSKLAKDVAAEANNLLIGRAALDVDLKRAGEALGLARSDFQRIRALPAGHFFAFGPALSESVCSIEVGPVETLHPRAGARAAPPPPPREKVRAVLAKLADLPAEAEAEARSVAELTAKLRAVERELAAAKRAAPEPSTAALATAHAKGAQAATEHMQAEHRRQLASVVAAAKGSRERAARALSEASAQLVKLDEKINAAHGSIEIAEHYLDEPIETPKTSPEYSGNYSGAVPQDAPSRPAPAPAVRSAAPARRESVSADGLDGAMQRLLDALMWWEVAGFDEPRKQHVGIVAGYRVKKQIGGHFGNLLGGLRSRGLVEYPTPLTAKLTDAGRSLANKPTEAPTAAEFHQLVKDRLDEAEWRILSGIIEPYPDPITKHEAGARAGYSVGASVGGHFGNMLGALRALGLIDYPTPQTVVGLPVLFLEVRR